ncbi:MAG TPA: ATP-dependent RNA helicase HrpA [Acidimicrobiales bacterium]
MSTQPTTDGADPPLPSAESLRLERRQALVPRVRYPAELPITERVPEVLETLRDHQVVVVAGETGSGKSTQLPKICLELGRGILGMIGHTQPRRLAARTVAERIAEELGTTIGAAVGYTVRFNDHVGDDTLVKVMTDGILLAEIRRDPDLADYDTIIVDEAHERSLNIDFILGYLRRLLPRRPDLKVIVTSATIDTARFSAHFGNAPVIEVSGRAYPVEVRYRPVVDDESDRGRDQTQAIGDAVRELQAEGPGDVLVFLSGEREIRDTAEALSGLELRHTEIVPLFARLSIAEQHRVFRPHTGRRVVLATNVAETSLTVPGIRYVVDAGTARISRFNRRTKVQRLPIEGISQASAAQRAGRCGRLGPGVCIRLYAEDDLLGRPAFTDPEIVRTNLASVILQMASIGLGDPAGFPFVDPPDRRAIGDGVALLQELGALDDDGRLTPSGRRMAQLPVDPRLARMILEAGELDCAREVLVLAAALSIQDPRERPLDRRAEADQLHARFRDPSSDFAAFLNLWDHLQDLQSTLGSNQFRRRCKAELLNHLRVREWQDVHGQLRLVARQLGIRANRQPADRDLVHRALLAGLLSHVGLRDGEGREFRGARGSRFVLSNGSALAKHPPRWVVAGELVETNRLWAHVAAGVRPEWIERAAGHLVVRSYGDPYWDPGRGRASGVERVTLFGLPLVSGRTVDWARVDPAGARDLFITHALVGHDWASHQGFLARNRAAIEQVEALEARVRRHGLLVDDDVRFAFFDARIPHHVVSTRHFERWWRTVRDRDPYLLDLTVPDLVDPDAGPIDVDAYPERWAVDGRHLALRYELDPGSPTDGVTVEVPLATLPRLDGASFDWHIPGHRLELVTSLIRTLPKTLRRNLSPAADHARAFLRDASPDDGPLLDVLAARLAPVAGQPIGRDDWHPEHLPPYLSVSFRVLDGRGRTVGEGRDLDRLRLRLRPLLRSGIAAAAAEAGLLREQHHLTAFPVDGLPRRLAVSWGGEELEGFPALIDEGDSVGVRILLSPEEQAAVMWAGTRQLLLLTVPSPLRVLRSRLTNRTKLGLGHAPHADYAALLDDCLVAAVDQLVATHGGPAWTAEDFRALTEAVGRDLPDRLVGVVAVVGRILESAHAIAERLDRLTAASLTGAVDDVRNQLDRLLYPGFVTTAGAARLPDLVRYLEAIDHRLDRLPENPRRDDERRERLQRFEREIRPGTRLGWLLEELRVSLFAQHLGTAERVSEQRIARELSGSGSGRWG